MRRFIVRPCDDAGSLEGALRERSWDVVDKSTGEVLANHTTRTSARADASERERTHAQKVER